MPETAVRKPKPAARRRAAPEAQPVRGRIPALAPAQAEALRTLFAAPRRWACGDATLRFAPGVAPAAAGTFALDAEGTRLRLRLDTDAAAPSPSGLHWSDYTGRARLLAWSLAHEAALMRLSEVIGVALLPVEDDADAPDDAPDDAVWLAFAGEHARADAGAPPSGALRLPVDWLARLQARAEPVYEDDPPPPLGALAALPVPVAIGFDGPRLASAEWRSLRPGDVVLVGNGRMPPLQARAARTAWPLAAAPDGWRITAAARPLPSPLEPSMNDESPGADPAAADTAGEAGAFPREMPVQLAFDIGRIEVGIGDLASLQPGYVFALPAHLEGANVTIRANGREAGRGEVVAVGETLGVRLLAWD
ncbi:MAG TPA: type III secretion system cytoplasmic ring protein SctQ [Luteimonas sp.]|nr:type III secretion system cytoplasmic ring protein SctQ [Luteimonas sp.]